MAATTDATAVEAGARPMASRKRRLDDLSPRSACLCELPVREAETVRIALERWGRLRQRVKALEPTLRREAALVQEILDTGLRVESQRTLRKLTQSGAGADAEEAIRQAGEAIRANREVLEGVLERNHGELVRLSAAAACDAKEEVLREMDEVLAGMKGVVDAVRCELLGAKERADMALVRRCGRSFNHLKAMIHRLEGERRLVTKNSMLAKLLVTVCRRVLPVRQVDPLALRDIPPSYEGYRQVMDFFFFTDAGLYCFGDCASGPNWLARPKRNVAILLVRDAEGRVAYNDFAVSGEHKTPGAALAPLGGPLQSMEAEDEHGRVFDRQHDAEFKLLSGLCASLAGTSADATTANLAVAINGTSLAGGPGTGSPVTRGANATAAGTCVASVGPSTGAVPDDTSRAAGDGAGDEAAASSATRGRSRSRSARRASGGVRGRNSWRGTGTLWSMKPLCRSCQDAVHQVSTFYPNVKLNVEVGGPDVDSLRWPLPLRHRGRRQATGARVNGCHLGSPPLGSAVDRPPGEEDRRAFLLSGTAAAASSTSSPASAQLAAPAATMLAATPFDAVLPLSLSSSSLSSSSSSSSSAALPASSSSPASALVSLAAAWAPTPLAATACLASAAPASRSDAPVSPASVEQSTPERPVSVSQTLAQPAPASPAQSGRVSSSAAPVSPFSSLELLAPAPVPRPLAPPQEAQASLAPPPTVATLPAALAAPSPPTTSPQLQATGGALPATVVG